MPFINVTITSKKNARGPVFVYAGEDTYTFCPITITLSATIVYGNPAGATFLWEQVLQYPYIAIDYGLRQFTFAGDISSTFYSGREVIELILENQVALKFDVTSVVYTGVNTIITVEQTLSPFVVPLTGVIQHAGSGTDGSFSWDTPPNQLEAIFTPTVTSDKVFRFWSNRGKAYQKFNDTEVVLTPRDKLLLTPLPTNVVKVDNSCREPIAFALQDPPLPYGSTTSEGGDTPNTWSMHWLPPSCDRYELVGYIAQVSCDGGDSWTTVSASTGADEIPITAGCSGRVAAVYASIGSGGFNVSSPTTSASAFFVHWSNRVYAGIDSQDKLLSAMSPLSAIGNTQDVTFEPIITFAVSGVIFLRPDDGLLETVPLFSPVLDSLDPISAIIVERLVQSFLPDEPGLTDQLLGNTTHLIGQPITNFVVSGSGTIGG